tara:strand:- start:1417 stop:2112 length:696 start_codon:yes stop_codon:yes gene_type:complete
MSTKISKTKLKELLRKLIVKELEEVSTTATAGGSYSTPHAFSGKGKDRRKDIASGSGYDEVNEAKLWKENSDKAVKDMINKRYVKRNQKEKDRVKGIGKWLDDRAHKISAKYNDNWIRRIKMGRGGQVQDWWGDTMSMIKVRLREQVENVNEGRYHEYRNDDSLTAKQKIGISMREVRDKLNELSKLIDMNVKLKNELNVDTKTYWKNTHKAMSKISERLVKLANKVGKLQ